MGLGNLLIGINGTWHFLRIPCEPQWKPGCSLYARIAILAATQPNPRCSLLAVIIVSSLREMGRGGFPERAEAKALTVAEVWLPPEPSGDGIHSSHPAAAAARQHAEAELRAAKEIAVRGAHRIDAPRGRDKLMARGLQVDCHILGGDQKHLILSRAKQWEVDSRIP